MASFQLPSGPNFLADIKKRSLSLSFRFFCEWKLNWIGKSDQRGKHNFGVDDTLYSNWSFFSLHWYQTKERFLSITIFPGFPIRYVKESFTFLFLSHVRKSNDTERKSTDIFLIHVVYPFLAIIHLSRGFFFFFFFFSSHDRLHVASRG